MDPFFVRYSDRKGERRGTYQPAALDRAPKLARIDSYCFFLGSSAGFR